MAFDQNSIPQELRPLNIVRTVAEETLITPVASSGRPVEGFYVAAPPPPQVGSPGTTVYYSPHMADAGLIGVGYSNDSPTHGATGWVQQVVPPSQPQLCVVSPGLVNQGSGHSHMPSFGGLSNNSDQTSEEGGDDSASSRKVKLLCSYGGKILPRPSDGALRYVGGQTRIISVRRDVGFNELVRNMVNIYGESVVIKYQLPEEDLDALVSVSCPDDLENMMDEYEKLSERSSDLSSKLRVFLVSASEVDSSGVVQFPDIRDSGQKYFEAVNGILEGSGDTTIKERTASSECSVVDVIDSCGQGLGEVNRPPITGRQSPRKSYVHLQEAIPKTALFDQGIHTNSSTGALGVPVMSGVTPTMPIRMDQEVDRSAPGIVPLNHGMEMQSPGATFPVSSSYMQNYSDPPQETRTRTEYVHFPSHLEYRAPIIRDVLPVMQQQQIAPGLSPHQFVPTVQVTMSPSSHLSMNPNRLPSVVQPQQFQRVDSTSGRRVVQVPVAYNPYQAQVSPQVLGGEYGCHQVPQQEQVAFSEGWMQNQQGAVSEIVTTFEGCNLCQKALPHAHSDTIAQNQKQPPASNLCGRKPVHYSLQLDGEGQPEVRTVTIGDHGERTVGQQGTAVQLPQVGKTQVEMMRVAQNLEGNFIDDGYVPWKEENPEQSMPQGVLGLNGGLQSQVGMVAAAVPQTYQGNAVQSVTAPMQYQIRQDTMSSRPATGVHPIIAAISSPLPDNNLYESQKHCNNNISFMVPKVDNEELYGSYDHQRLMERGMENFQIHPAEMIRNKGQNKLLADSLKMGDVRENRLPSCGEAESSWNVNFGDHHTAPGGNQLNQIEMLPVSASESPFSHNVCPTGSHEVAQSPFISNPLMQSQGMPDSFDICDEIYSASTQPQPYGVGDMEYSSKSLFSHQDPWNFQQDTNLSPPRPKILPLKREVYDTRDPAGVILQTDVNQFPVSSGGAFITQRSLEDEINQVSAEEFIKQELQAVAEGVAASVFQSPAEIQENTDVQRTVVQVENEDHFEEVEAVRPEKMDLGSPLSEDIGRLQIIRNTDLEELWELGSGTFGTVYHGKWRGTDVAIKRINDRCFTGKPSEQERMREDFWNEAIKLADLHHPNVVAFYGVVLDGPGGSVATVTEFMVNGSLRTALQKNERNLDKRKRLLIAMDVAFGMEYLHGKNIVHFDLKSDNLLVNLRDPHRPICKVGDLGLSKVKCQTLISGGVRGTLPWLAPELLNGSSSLVSEKVDVYSFGIVLWELLTGEEPYADLHYGTIIGGIVSNTLRPPIPESCDPDWRSLMERCWSSEPPERPNFTEIAVNLRAMSSKIPAKRRMQHSHPKAKS
ncbi:hypothetical protein Leryth_010339 [Lithospermum erythrorhizon]|nr:hypothetical protein Leryth_010339 [Lithospermum erythrorhizon]